MGKTKNASCSELGDEKASGSELRDLQPRGFDRGICTSTSNLIAYSELGIIKDICLSTITKCGEQ